MRTGLCFDRARQPALRAARTAVRIAIGDAGLEEGQAFGAAADLAGVCHRASASAASFVTVFQFRAVPRVPSFFSIKAAVKRDRPWPFG